jgi:hypothetical protein
MRNAEMASIAAAVLRQSFTGENATAPR